MAVEPLQRDGIGPSSSAVLLKLHERESQSKTPSGGRNRSRRSEAGFTWRVSDDLKLRLEAAGVDCFRTKQILEFGAAGIYLVPQWN